MTLTKMAIEAASNASAEASDLAQLWQGAVEDYEKRTGKNLKLGQFRSMNDVMAGTEGLATRFKDFRDDKSKMAKVRTALKNNMWIIQKVVNTIQTVGTAVSAFPPAMPASLIFTAFGQVMQSFADTSADYDKIMGFFEFTHRFFDRLSIIEERTPALPPFQRCVTRVFSSILKICAVAQKYAAEKRFKKWFENLVKGADGDLTAANSEMEEAINELSQAVGLATLRTVEIIDEVVKSMNGQVEFLVANATLLDERTEAIQSNTNTIMEQNQDLGSKQDAMTQLQKETLEMVSEQSRLFSSVVGYFGSVQMGENFGDSFKTSVLKLGVVRLRLARWGQSVGLANVNDVHSLEESKLSPDDIPRVSELLEGILDQFADAERISKRFQLRHRNATAVLDPTKDLDKVAASLHQKINDLSLRRQGNSDAEPNKELTLYEEKNFTRLIEDINELVNDLVELFPGIEDAQRKLAEEEVSEMKSIKGALPILKEVAADQDNLLTETVVKVIQQTSTTTYTNSVVFSGNNSGFQVGNNAGRISKVRWN
ncbi:hypothetical protein BO86DRAFT_367342 [Aspergillus japonicus CBS 114.51]|uniref:Prion-inhibition and propagation HeLo domain-containing protein n=1 Tax=Aspergillus japonicus CBS 114.51 TaxID=1448312 RepID=A0A8T8WTC5_ASPJA|nr:hypothetical protein BO86DRAFT_367342 [Aspergillus japonicus CBS 114.51]RAH79096.1 hypothetical protein BO86DRAFT_367342 [Aspergillus japonicus CBS 114.51]